MLGWCSFTFIIYFSVFDSDELENKITQDIDYVAIDNIRELERKRSLDYLKKNLR